MITKGQDSGELARSRGVYSSILPVVERFVYIGELGENSGSNHVRSEVCQQVIWAFSFRPKHLHPEYWFCLFGFAVVWVF